MTSVIGVACPPAEYKVREDFLHSIPIMGSLLVLSSAILYGVSAILIKVAYAHGMTPLAILSLRHVLAAAILWAALLLTRRLVPLSRRSVASLLAIGATLVPVQVFGFFLALRYLPASSVAVLAYVFPLHVAWMGWLFLGERLRLDEGIVLLLVVMGAVLVAGQTPSLQRNAGLAAIALCTLANAAYIVAGRRIVLDVPPLQAQAVMLMATAVVFALFGFGTGQLHLAYPRTGLLATLALAIFATVLAALLLLSGLRLMRAARAAVLGTLEPVVTVVLSVLLLGDQLTVMRVAGSAMILGGIVVLVGRRGEKASQGQLQRVQAITTAEG